MSGGLPDESRIFSDHPFPETLQVTPYVRLWNCTRRLFVSLCDVQRQIDFTDRGGPLDFPCMRDRSRCTNSSHTGPFAFPAAAARDAGAI